MRERVESEAVMFREPTAERRPEKLCVGVILLIIILLYEPWIRSDTVSSSSPGAVQVIVVPLYANGIFVKSKLPIPLN